MPNLTTHQDLRAAEWTQVRAEDGAAEIVVITAAGLLFSEADKIRAHGMGVGLEEKSQ